jgi:hypothetical protein
MRAVVLAVMAMALTANAAAANDEGWGSDCVPYDPGLPSIQE